mmetsp:Transcript_15746/g.23636  ORF Transcript_15746/g.23636 Transcript_15746/m.23636 type:complete len:369 (+) Transcript_15746:3-1109(+)
MLKSAFAAMTSRPTSTPSRPVDWVDSSDSDDTGSHGADTETATPKHMVNTYDTGSITSGAQFFPIKYTLSSERYDASSIREEFRRYQSILPKPDILLQEQHSFEVLREMMIQKDVELPRFLKLQSEGGIKPHYALCCLLMQELEELSSKPARCKNCFCSSLIKVLSFGCLYRPSHVPADIIREQFFRVAHVIPSDLVRPSTLRKKIRNRSLPIPNFFLDPEDDKQFPPHIALLVVLQDGEDESRHFDDPLYGIAWSLFSFAALVLRLVLEVIGGAGAIWGGSEVFGLRYDGNKEFWRYFSIAVGVACFLRFVTLNAPYKEDVGDILGPAGPWSLRAPVRLRAVTEHPFHYFVRAQPPFSLTTKEKKKH